MPTRLCSAEEPRRVEHLQTCSPSLLPRCRGYQRATGASSALPQPTSWWSCRSHGSHALRRCAEDVSISQDALEQLARVLLAVLFASIALCVVALRM